MSCSLIQFVLAVHLRELARAESIELEEDLHLSMPLRYENEDLKHLETAFDSYPANCKTIRWSCSFIEAADPRAEIHAVARTIRELTTAGNGIRTLLLLYRQPEKYDELIETIFPQYEIPVFISRKKPMLHHPLIEFSRSVLEAVTSGWSYESVFRAVKTDLFFPHRGR